MQYCDINKAKQYNQIDKGINVMYALKTITEPSNKQQHACANERLMETNDIVHLPATFWRFCHQQSSVVSLIE
jgi:hypothetical protein